jgi:hypothetical protein
MPDDLTATPTEPHWLTIADAARLIERRQLSPVELTDALLSRIEALDPQLNAFLLPTPEKAREQSRAAEREIMAGSYRGPLHGISYGLKDIYATAGTRTTSHSKICENSSRPKMRPPSRSFTRPAGYCLASSRPMSSPMEGHRSICPGRRRATHGTAITSPAARRAAPGRQLPPDLSRARSAEQRVQAHMNLFEVISLVILEPASVQQELAVLI